MAIVVEDAPRGLPDARGGVQLYLPEGVLANCVVCLIHHDHVRMPQVVDAQRQGEGLRAADLEALVEVHAGEGGRHVTDGRHGIETVAGNIVPRRCAECRAVGAKPCGGADHLRGNRAGEQEQCGEQGC